MNMTLGQFLKGERQKGYGGAGTGPNASPWDMHNAFVHAENEKRQAPQALQSDPRDPQTYGQFLGTEHAKEKNSASKRSKSMPITLVLNPGQQAVTNMKPGPEVTIDSVSLVQSSGPFDLAVMYKGRVYASTPSEQWRQNRTLGFDVPIELPKNQSLLLILRNRHNGPNEVQMIFEGVSQWR